MSDSTIKALPLEARIALHTELLKHMILPSCSNCIFMRGNAYKAPAHDKIICDKYKQPPPIKVIAEGCVGWEQDIPF